MNLSKTIKIMGTKEAKDNADILYDIIWDCIDQNQTTLSEAISVLEQIKLELLINAIQEKNEE